MTVSLSQVLASARARSAPLAGECAGYLVLAAADHAAQGPRRIEAGSVELHSDGSVRVVGGLPADEATTERDLRDLLDELLLVAGSVTPALLRSARRRTGVGIDGFVREIETALIPVNRAAARRALSRLARETSRAVERGALVIENQRVSDRALAPERAVRSAPPPVIPPDTPPPASITPPPASRTPPPVTAAQSNRETQRPPPAAPSSRPATDLLPTPVAVPVRPKIVVEPLLEETPSKFETRPETVLARASLRPPATFRAPEPAPSEERPLASPEPAPVSVSPCAPPPVESMTPFLGTAMALRGPAPVVVHDTAKAVVQEAPPVVVRDTANAVVHELADEDVVDDSPDELTEPFYLEGDGREDVGLAFHELTALMGNVAPVSEPVLELAESPAPAVETLEEAAEPVLELAESARPVPEVAPLAAPESEVVSAAAAPSVNEELDVVVETVEEIAVVATQVDAAESAEAAEEQAELPEVVEELAVEAIEADDVEELAASGDVEGELAAWGDAQDELVAAPEAVEAAPVAPPRGEFDDVELAVMLPSAEPPPVRMRRPATDPAALLPRRPLPQKRTSNVDELLQSFGHASHEHGEEGDVRTTLKRLAGLDPTPPPPDATNR